MSRICFLGNFHVNFSSESHHALTLEKLGHTVIRLQEGETPAESVLSWARDCQAFVWIHTHGWEVPSYTYPAVSMIDVLGRLKELGIPTLSYHLDLWLGLRREQDLTTDPFYTHIGHFFSVDRLMADWFNAHTEVKGHFLQAGVFEDEAILLPPTVHPLHDIVFVGSYGYHPEWPWRNQLINWLRLTYGDRFTHYGNGGLGTLRGMPLNQVYANTKIVVGDSLCPGFDYPDYTTDRVYETTGRGGFIIFPDIRGLEKQFEYGKEIETYKYGDFSGLKEKIDYYLTHDEEREAIRRAGFTRTRNNYTYTDRWKTILAVIGI